MVFTSQSSSILSTNFLNLPQLLFHPASVCLHSTALHLWWESEMSLFSPPSSSSSSSLAVFKLNRCQCWVKSSPEGLPAAYWFIINEIRAAVCRGGFGPRVDRCRARKTDNWRHSRGQTERDRADT